MPPLSKPDASTSSPRDAVLRFARPATQVTRPVAIEGRALVPSPSDGMADADARLERARTLLASLRYTGESAQPERLNWPPAVRGAIAPEASAPVGVANYEFRQFEPLHLAIADNRQVSRADLLALNDDAAKAMVTEFFGNRLHGRELGPGTCLAPQALVQLRNFIRAAELGLAVTVHPSVWSKDWPATPEVAALLLRAARAFEVPDESIVVGGRALSELNRREVTPALDLGRSLLNFYPSLKVGKLLGQEPLLAPGVASFVASLKLPADIEHLVRDAVGEQVFSAVAGDGERTQARPVTRAHVVAEGPPKLDDALADERGARLAPEAQAEVQRAVEAVCGADVITRDAALDGVKTAVLAHSALVSPRELVRSALTALYEKDLEQVAPLGEVEGAVGKVKGEVFVDPRPVIERLGTAAASLELFDLARREPKLARQLEHLKSRVELQQLGADPDTLAAAAVEAGQRLLDAQAGLDPALQQAFLEHLATWAYSR